MKISIIIPIYNQSHLTERCLTDLMHLNESHEIIIINNGSTDDSLTKIENILKSNARFTRPSFKILNSNENLGFAKAMNWGYSMSVGEVVIFLNNDIRVTSDLESWTQKIVDELSFHDRLLLSPTGGLIDNNFNFVHEIDAKKINSLNTKIPWNYLSGWLLAGKRSTFDLFGEVEKPFITDFTTYFEDSWLSFRARQLDIELKLFEVPLVHLKRQTSKTMNLNNMYISARKKFIEAFKKEDFKL